jgi:hypothetical protein
MISVLRDSILARLLVAGRGPAVQHGHVTEYQNAGYNVHFCVAVKGPSITLCPYLSVLRQCPQVQGSDRSALPRWLVPAAAMAAVGRYSRCQVNFPPDNIFLIPLADLSSCAKVLVLVQKAAHSRASDVRITAVCRSPTGDAWFLCNRCGKG